MPRPKARPRRHTDPAGEAWQADADARWRAAGGMPERYTAPPMPAWTRPTQLPAWIERPFGRYVWGGEQRLLHDLEHAANTCELERLASASGVHFVHFAAELEVAVPDDVADCGACMTEA